ncbi:hypothetical protein LUQ84_001363 [Hamiltosporidium tvaerminnensis]|nr:hypothetical protein LUQ84_001363 [Hamiltosporidium tvaerminnensis]
MFKVVRLVSRETYEPISLQILEKNLPNQNIEIKIPFHRTVLIQRYIPEAFAFFEKTNIMISLANQALKLKICKLLEKKLTELKLKTYFSIDSNLENYFIYLLTLELDNTPEAPSSLEPVSLLLPEPESKPVREPETIREPETKQEPALKREPETKRETAPKHASERAPEAIANKPFKNVHKKENTPNTKVEQNNNGNNLENLTEMTSGSKLKKQKSNTLESEIESKTSEEKLQKGNNGFITILIVVLVFTSVIGIFAAGYWIYIKQLE